MLEPSALMLTTCSDNPLLTICGFTVALSSNPFKVTVPSPGLVETLPATNLPSTGTASWIDCLMPSADQVMVPFSDPIVPLELLAPFRLMSWMSRLTFMPLAERTWLPAVCAEMSE